MSHPSCQGCAPWCSQHTWACTLSCVAHNSPSLQIGAQDNTCICEYGIAVVHRQASYEYCSTSLMTNGAVTMR
eukprot:7490877-Pyramimonas_sp.AAC.2